MFLYDLETRELKLPTCSREQVIHKISWQKYKQIGSIVLKSFRFEVFKMRESAPKTKMGDNFC